jgi:oxygen-independent coproporphyrinogen-3 oxidase
VHLQNLDSFDPYCAAIEQGTLPLGRGYRPSGEERFVREFVLQLKLGAVRPAYFADKYGVDVLARFREQLSRLADAKLLTAARDRITLSREGLLRVDSMLPQFFLPQHQGLRYT